MVNLKAINLNRLKQTHELSKQWKWKLVKLAHVANASVKKKKKKRYGGGDNDIHAPL